MDAATGESPASDYCGQRRDATPDIGAVEYTSASPCDTSATHALGLSSDGGGEDMGQGGADMGPSDGEDAGATDPDTDMDSGGDADPGDGSPDAGGASSGTGGSDEEGSDGCSSAPSGAPSSPLGALAALALVGFSRRRA